MYLLKCAEELYVIVWTLLIDGQYFLYLSQLLLIPVNVLLRKRVPGATPGVRQLGESSGSFLVPHPMRIFDSLPQYLACFLQHDSVIFFS
jgi:hypothetical protein